MPADPIGDLLVDLSTILPSHFDTFAPSTDIPSFSTSVPPLAQPAPTTAHVDPSVALIGLMSILIEQQAHMMEEITHLRATSKHHTTEFAALRITIAYVQQGIQWCGSTGIMTLMLVILMRRRWG